MLRVLNTLFIDVVTRLRWGRAPFARPNRISKHKLPLRLHARPGLARARTFSLRIAYTTLTAPKKLICPPR
jgi:hypothetical protein